MWRRKPRTTKTTTEFCKGYICAVSTLLRQHGKDTYAKDLLGCIGLVDWRKIPEYDREPLRKAGLIKPAPTEEGA